MNGAVWIVTTMRNGEIVDMEVLDVAPSPELYDGWRDAATPGDKLIVREGNVNGGDTVPAGWALADDTPPPPPGFKPDRYQGMLDRHQP